MDMIDALWYGALSPGEVLEKQNEKQKALARLTEQSASIFGRDGSCGFLAPLGMT